MTLLSKTCHATDRVSLSQRIFTEEGYLQAPGTLARTGIQDYAAWELGLDNLEPLRIVRLYRPPEEVFSPASMQSFEGKPVTLNHPQIAVTAQNWKQHAVGEVLHVQRSGEYLTGTLILKDHVAIQAVQSGKVALSNGYTFDLEMTPGKTPDEQPYDGTQHTIRGNHVALVDAARCGSACRMADMQTFSTAEACKMDAKCKVVVDKIPLTVDDTAAAALEKLLQERDNALEAHQALARKLTAIQLGDKTLSLDELITLAQEQATHITALQKDVMTPEQRDALVADWSKTLQEAQALVPGFVTDGKTCLAIRREVLQTLSVQDATAKHIAEAVLGEESSESADLPKVRAAFKAVAAALSQKPQQGSDALGKALLNESCEGASVGGRALFMQRQAVAWK